MDLNSVKSMTPDSFNQYLKAMLGATVDCQTVNGVPKTMEEIAECIRRESTLLNNVEAKMFQNGHLKTGKLLLIAKRKFDCEKRKKKLKQTWVMWIEENTPIKQAYDRQHREIATLIQEFPKLANLQISYADFLKIKRKIRYVFYDNVHIGEEWN